MNTLGKSFDWKKFLLFVQLLCVIVAPAIMFFCFAVVALAMFGSKTEGQGIIASYFVVSVVGFTLLLLDSYLNGDYSHLETLEETLFESFIEELRSIAVVPLQKCYGWQGVIHDKGFVMWLRSNWVIKLFPVIEFALMVTWVWIFVLEFVPRRTYIALTCKKNR